MLFNFIQISIDIKVTLATVGYSLNCVSDFKIIAIESKKVWCHLSYFQSLLSYSFSVDKKKMCSENQYKICNQWFDVMKRTYDFSFKPKYHCEHGSKNVNSAQYLRQQFYRTLATVGSDFVNCNKKYGCYLSAVFHTSQWLSLNYVNEESKIINQIKTLLCASLNV